MCTSSCLARILQDLQFIRDNDTQSIRHTDKLVGILGEYELADVNLAVDTCNKLVDERKPNFYWNVR